MIYSIDELKSKLTPVFAKHNIAKASVFGSYARGEAESGHDVDLAISTKKTMDLEEYYDFLKDLYTVLQTKPDITFEDYINPFMKPDIMSEAVLIYEE